MRLRASIAVGTTCLAALAAGCGGDDGGGQSFDAQTYASDTCDVALLWSVASEDLTGLLDQSVELDAAEEAVVNAQEKTSVYIGTLRDVEEPDDAQGKAAHESLQATADTLSQHSQAIRSEGQPLAMGDTTPEQAAKAVLPQIDAILGDLRESVKQLDAIAPDADLTAIVRDDQACRALGV